MKVLTVQIALLTILFIAGHEECMSVLIDHGADIGDYHLWDHIACEAMNYSREAVLIYLLRVTGNIKNVMIAGALGAIARLAFTGASSAGSPTSSHKNDDGEKGKEMV